jgi:hypothetical protein
MNERIQELAEQAGFYYTDKTGFITPAGCDPAKFAESIVRECAKLNRTQSYELSGVVVDTEDGHGFDDVCLTTVKRVEQYLAGDDLLKHFGVEE